MGLSVKLWAQPPSGGALSSLYAATAPGVTGGSYFGPEKFMETSGSPKRTKGNRASRDEAAQRRLWEVSEEMTGVRFEFAGSPAPA
jgi:hypothetical protein